MLISALQNGSMSFQTCELVRSLWNVFLLSTSSLGHLGISYSLDGRVCDLGDLSTWWMISTAKKKKHKGRRAYVII